MVHTNSKLGCQTNNPEKNKVIGGTPNQPITADMLVTVDGVTFNGSPVALYYGKNGKLADVIRDANSGTFLHAWNKPVQSAMGVFDPKACNVVIDGEPVAAQYRPAGFFNGNHSSEMNYLERYFTVLELSGRTGTMVVSDEVVELSGYIIFVVKPDRRGGTLTAAKYSRQSTHKCYNA